MGINNLLGEFSFRNFNFSLISCSNASWSIFCWRGYKSHSRANSRNSRFTGAIGSRGSVAHISEPRGQLHIHIGSHLRARAVFDKFFPEARTERDRDHHYNRHSRLATWILFELASTLFCWQESKTRCVLQTSSLSIF